MANPNIVNVTSILGNTLVTTMSSTADTSILANSTTSGQIYKIESIQAANLLASSACNINLTVDDGSNNKSLLKTVDIATGSTLVAVDRNSTIYLPEGYSLKGSSEFSSALDLIISYEVIS